MAKIEDTDFEVVWNGEMISPWGEKGSLLPPTSYYGGSTWILVENWLYSVYGRPKGDKEHDDAGPEGSSEKVKHA